MSLSAAQAQTTTNTAAAACATNDLYRTTDTDIDRAARVARYKEQRRRQLETQFHDVSSSSSSVSSTTVAVHSSTATSSGRPRRYITRTPRNDGGKVVVTANTSSSAAAGDHADQLLNATSARASAAVVSEQNHNSCINSHHNTCSMAATTSTSPSASVAPGGAAGGGGGFVRTTRTSRLRSISNQTSAVVDAINNPHRLQSHQATSAPGVPGGDGGVGQKLALYSSTTASEEEVSEKSTRLPVNGTSPTSTSSNLSSPRHRSRISSLRSPVGGGDKDKSSKRKSNLNRSLNTEEVPLSDNLVVNQRRRHLAPITVTTNLTSTAPLSPTITNYKLIDTNNTSSSAAATQKVQPQRKPSQLSIHMENARRSISSATTTKENTTTTKRPSITVTASSPRGADASSKTLKRNKVNSSLKKPIKTVDNSVTAKKRPSSATSSDRSPLNTLPRRSYSDTISPRKGTSPAASPAKEKYAAINEVSRRMDSLTQLTRSTLARVDRLQAARRGGAGDVANEPRKKDLTKTDKTSQIVVDNVENGAQIVEKPNMSEDDASKPRQKLVCRVFKPVAGRSAGDAIKTPQKIVSKPNSSQTSEGDVVTSQQKVASVVLKPDSCQTAEDDVKPQKVDGGVSTSILKKKSNDGSILKHQLGASAKEETRELSPPQQAQPVSILKRKTSQDETEHVNESAPVTFSPSVVDPPTASRRRQSILKKRRSLDESEVLRRRSCSPDVIIIEGTASDFRPILKQRRSSLEEIRVGSPEPQGILKRKPSRGGDDNFGLEDRSVIDSPEPQSILKRKSGSSSSGSNGSQQHVSIAAAVILAAAGGAEIICGGGGSGNDETVRPILKKKSISSEDSPNVLETRPILKKKYSTDTDDLEDRPKKPILKMSARTQDSQDYSDNETSSQGKRTLRTRSSESSSSFETSSPVRKLSNRTSGADSSDELVSILKQSCSRESSPRPRLSFCEEFTADNHLNSVESSETSPSIPEFPFLRRPSMSPVLRSRSSGSDYDERYRRRRTIHLGEGERFFDDSSIRLRRQSMSDMADPALQGAPGGGGSSCSMSVAERILRMETFLAQEHKNTKANAHHVVMRRKSSLRSNVDVGADPHRFHSGHNSIGRQQPSSPTSASTSTSPSTSTSGSVVISTVSSKNLITHGSHGALEASQLSSQNGGERISSNSLLRQETGVVSTVTLDDAEQQHLPPRRQSSTATLVNHSNNQHTSLASSVQSIELMSSELTAGEQQHQEAATASSTDSGCVLIKMTSDAPLRDSSSASLLSTAGQHAHRPQQQPPNESTSQDGSEMSRAPVDDTTSVTERRSSVSSRAAAFNKQVEDQKKAATGELVKKKSVNAGIERLKHRKALRNSPSDQSRFATQPVTYGEIQEAAKQNQVAAAAAAEDNDPSKLTLAERVKLFNEKMAEEMRMKTVNLGPPPMRKRYSRFKTQPITTDEVQSAQQKIINPLIASFVKPPSSEELGGLSIKQTKDKINQHAVRMLTHEVKAADPKKPSAKKTQIGDQPHELSSAPPQSTTAVTTTTMTTVTTPTATATTITSPQPSIKTIYKDFSEHLKQSDSVNSSSTSEGESSGAREIKCIIKSGNNDACTTTTSHHSASRRRGAAGGGAYCGDKKFLHKSKSESYRTNDIIDSRNESNDVNGRIESAHPRGDDEHYNDQNILERLHPKSLIQELANLHLHNNNNNNNNYINKSLHLINEDDPPPRTAMPASADDVPDNVTVANPSSVSIAERRAALQHAGNNDWKRRLVPITKLTEGELKNIVVTTNNKINESTKHEEKTSELITSSPVLAERVCKLETASQGWKKRVEQSDAINFTVAGRMRDNVIPVSPSLPNIPASGNKVKRVPKPARFKTKQERLDSNAKDSDVTLTLTRSISVPNSSGDAISGAADGLRVSVPRADDEAFTSFFTSSFHEQKLVTSKTTYELRSEDLDVVTRTTNDKLLGHKRIVKIQRKHMSKNPIKTLNARSDLCNEYTEVNTGVAERELTRIKAEKLAKNSNMAIAALAGLASKEDFTAINLKKTTTTANSTTFSMLPYTDLMLVHVKGRRHVQARLVEPAVSSINRGDNYVLLTKSQVFHYQGLYSNIIEQSRATEIANASALNGNKQIITIHEEKNTCTAKHMQEFWKLLGHDDTQQSAPSVNDAGHPDEDEIYESKIIDTNMVYELDGDELIPHTAYWGCIPRIEMLDPCKILVFDFGTELYVWNGKNSSLDRRKTAVKLAKELWQEGYDYTGCDICPITATQMLGANRGKSVDVKKSNSRPSWALLAKITQNMEPILFREKFLDWPDYSRVIKIKTDQADKSLNIVIKPLDVARMLQPNPTAPDLVLEGSHLGRGTQYCDLETNRVFEISTISVKKWHIQEFEYFELGDEDLAHFYSGDSFILRWQYMVTVTGRELSGKPSRHSMAGRDRCAYFCWQGKDASLNEKGAAALLTVELDLERGPQIRVTEGFETPAFLNLFNGGMVVHAGKMEDVEEGPTASWRLYFCRGDAENETFLTEVPCNMRQLRSRASMVFLNLDESRLILWHGAKSLEHTRKMARSAVEKLKLSKSACLRFHEPAIINEVDEGCETAELLHILGASQGRQLYASLLKHPYDYAETPRLFCFSSVSGVFEANEILCPHRRSDEHGVVTAYPFLQSELYAASQPTIFLFDQGDTLWLWQGWWPEMHSDSDRDSPSYLSDQTGSGAVRWQEERRAAMQTTINYWRQKYGKLTVEANHDKKENEKCPAVLVWAGLEPLEFTNLFPTWTDRDDIAEINIRDGRKPGEMLSLNSELERLTCSTYPAAVLLQRPLPEGVDPTRLEEYLSPNHFTQMFNGLTKEQFYELPTWKQTNLKKEFGLF